MGQLEQAEKHLIAEISKFEANSYSYTQISDSQKILK